MKSGAISLSPCSRSLIVKGVKRRMRELFSTGCVSCREKMLSEICEASLGKCAPRQMRKLVVSCAQARAAGALMAHVM